jgi:1-acyl-sn-glycerol-3-phosphate acyltransferase
VRVVGSLLFWAFVAISSVLLFPVALLVWAVTAPFDPRRRALHQFTCFWASIYTWLNPAWRVSIRGREHLDPDRTVVYAANHLSLLDILVLFRLFTPFRWVSKIEVFRIPVIGWNMRLNKYIPLRRGDGASVRAMLATAEQSLRDEVSLMIFPEGTRSPTGEMRLFKSGAFELAKRTSVPVVPIVVEGTFDALPKQGLTLQGRHPIRVTVLPAVPTETVDALSVEELSDHVRGLIAAQLADDPLVAPSHE